MRKTLRIGITGGIGSGKTTVTQLFAHLGVPVYLADDRAKWLMNNHPDIVKQVKKLFGQKAYEKGILNRAHIATKAFSNKTLIMQLNQVVHPAVFHDFDTWSKQQQAPYVLKEAALLFESNSYLELDAIIGVSAPEALRISRTMHRDNATYDAVLGRMKNQMNDDRKIAASDFEVINNGEELLLPQVLQLHHQFMCG